MPRKLCGVRAEHIASTAICRLAYGVAGSFGSGPITLTGMVGAWTPKNYSAQTSYGADIAYKLFGGGLLPVAVGLQAGYGSVKAPLPVGGTATRTTIPLGVGISFDPPLFPLKPWIAPRVDLTSVSGGGNTSTFRISAGVNFSLLLGLGIHAAVDWGQTKAGGSTVSPLILGVGAHFNLHVPMM